MVWLSIYIGILTGGLIASIFYYFVAKNKINKKIAQGLTLIAIILSFIGTQFYVGPHYLAYVFENKIKSEDPIFSLLAEKSPLEFNNYIAKIKNCFLDNKSDMVSYYTGIYLYSQLRKYSPYASNQSFYSLGKATLALYNKIYVINPSLVLDLEFNLQSERNLNYKKLGVGYDQALNPIFNAKKMIIESGISNPQPLLSESDKIKAQAIIQTIILKLSANYGDNIVSNTFHHPDDPSLNQKIAAEIIIQFYQMLLDRGNDTAGLVIKYIFSINDLRS